MTIRIPRAWPKIKTWDNERVLWIMKSGASLLVAFGLEEMKEFADTVTAMVAEEEERQQRIKDS